MVLLLGILMFMYCTNYKLCMLSALRYFFGFDRRECVTKMFLSLGLTTLARYVHTKYS